MERFIDGMMTATFAAFALLVFVSIVIGLPVLAYVEFTNVRTADDCRVAAALWAVSPSAVRACTQSGCDVTTAAGCEVHLTCDGSTNPDDKRPVYVERKDVRCPGQASPVLYE